MKAKLFVQGALLLLLASASVFGNNAAAAAVEAADPCRRTFVSPTRVVWTSGTNDASVVSNAVPCGGGEGARGEG